MPQILTAADLVYAYLGLLVAFSVAQLLLATHGTRVRIGFWITANLFSAVGVANALHPQNSSEWVNLSQYAVMSVQIGLLCRFLSLSYRKSSFNRDRLAEVFFLMSVFAIPLIAIPALDSYKLLIGSCVGASTSAACSLTAMSNPALKFSNKTPITLIVLVMTIGIVGLIYRASTAYPFTTELLFVGTSKIQILAIAWLLLSSFFLQCGFTGVLTEQRQRAAIRNDRASILIRGRNIRLQQHVTDTARVARFRLDLVQLLTHEVRQPIANTQAAIQSINHNLKIHATKKNQEKKFFALVRAQNALQYITLSLSNIIVCFTIISDDRKWMNESIDISEVLKFSILDFSEADRARIKFFNDHNFTFISSNSVLLRLALQNIINYAVKFSESDTFIEIHLSLNEKLNFLIIDIDFKSTRQDLVNENIFLWHSSGDTARSDVPALSMLVVRQIAGVLGGGVQLLSRIPGRLNFQLTMVY